MQAGHIRAGFLLCGAGLAVGIALYSNVRWVQSDRGPLLEPVFGYIDKTGEFVIPPQFDFAGDFSEGLAAVKMDGKTGFVDSAGRIIIPLRFEDAGPFSEKLAAVSLDGKIGYIDPAGILAIPPRFNYGGVFSEGLAPVGIDARLRLGPRDDERGGTGGFRFVRRYGYINRDGEMAIQPQFRNARSFTEGLARVTAQDNLTGYIDREGDPVIPCEFEQAGPFCGGVARVYSDGRWRLIDREGEFVDDPQSAVAGDLSGMLLPVSASPTDPPATLSAYLTPRRWGFQDLAGKVVIRPRFEKVRNFTEGLAAVRFDGRFGYIDKTGEFVIPAHFDSAFPFREGLARVLIRRPMD